jgi:protein-S-isoprenylcysteine O-methyltransferase Ste14
MILGKKWQKVTLRTVPVYLLAGMLLFYARPTLFSYLAGTVLVLFGEAARIWAAGHLQKNEVLTTTGPYAYLKNPLYFGTFWIMVGFCLMARNLPLLGVGLAGFLFYYAPYKKRREGGKLLERFGERWEDYDHEVPDYFPRLTPYQRRGERKWSRTLFLRNDEQGTLLSVLLGLLLVALRFWV